MDTKSTMNISQILLPEKTSISDTNQYQYLAFNFNDNLGNMYLVAISQQSKIQIIANM